MSDRDPEAYNPRTPISVDRAQWPEGRGFRRVYVGDPDRQSRIAMGLIGFKHELELYGKKDSPAIEAIDIVLRAFYEQHPEFLIEGFERDPETEMGRGLYYPDDRLIHYMGQVLENDGPETG